LVKSVSRDICTKR